eukprot:363362-Chlamydomonas_euryale.AAC.3
MPSTPGGAAPCIATTCLGETKRYKAFKAWAKQVAETPRPKDPMRRRGKTGGGGASALATGSEDSFAAAMVARRAEVWAGMAVDLRVWKPHTMSYIYTRIHTRTPPQLLVNCCWGPDNHKGQEWQAGIRLPPSQAGRQAGRQAGVRLDLRQAGICPPPSQAGRRPPRSQTGRQTAASVSGRQAYAFLRLRQAGRQAGRRQSQAGRHTPASIGRQAAVPSLGLAAGLAGVDGAGSELR